MIIVNDEDVSKIKRSVFHVIPSLACNLNCSHCDVHFKEQIHRFNEEKFFDVLERIPIETNKFILFGGEPLINNKRILFKLMDSKRFATMTSNFLLLDEEIMQKIIDNNITIGTSWNPDRFTPETYKLWKSKIKFVRDHKRSVEVFITMTEDLFANHFQEMLEVLDDCQDLGVYNISLSMVVPTNPGLVNKVDNFFCWLDDNWMKRWPRMRNRIGKAIYGCDGSKNNCITRSYTLFPDGILDQQCTHNEDEFFYGGYEQCPTCEFKQVCTPCPKQPCCHFYKNYWLKIAGRTMLEQQNEKLAKANKERDQQLRRATPLRAKDNPVNVNYVINYANNKKFALPLNKMRIVNKDVRVSVVKTPLENPNAKNYLQK